VAGVTVREELASESIYVKQPAKPRVSRDMSPSNITILNQVASKTLNIPEKEDTGIYMKLMRLSGDRGTRSS
jgi:hypothetical protein